MVTLINIINVMVSLFPRKYIIVQFDNSVVSYFLVKFISGKKGKGDCLLKLNYQIKITRMR